MGTRNLGDSVAGTASKFGPADAKWRYFESAGGLVITS